VQRGLTGYTQFEEKKKKKKRLPVTLSPVAVESVPTKEKKGGAGRGNAYLETNNDRQRPSPRREKESGVQRSISERRPKASFHAGRKKGVGEVALGKREGHR